MQGTAVPPAWTLVYRYCYGVRRVSKVLDLLVLCASCFVHDPPLCPHTPMSPRLIWALPVRTGSEVLLRPLYFLLTLQCSALAVSL